MPSYVLTITNDLVDTTRLSSRSCHMHSFAVLPGIPCKGLCTIAPIHRRWLTAWVGYKVRTRRTVPRYVRTGHGWRIGSRDVRPFCWNGGGTRD